MFSSTDKNIVITQNDNLKKNSTMEQLSYQAHKLLIENI